MPDTLITQIVDPAAYAQLDKLNKSLSATEKQAAETVVQLTQLTAVFRDASGIQQLVKAQEGYVKTTKQASEYEKALAAQRKASEKAAAQLAIAEQKIGEVMATQAKSIAQAREQNKVLNQVRNNLVVTDEKTAKRLNELNAKLDENNDFIKENADAYLKQKINIGNYQSALDGLPGTLGKVASGASGVTKGIKSITKAAVTFMATPLGVVIAALVAGFTLLKSGLSRTEEGQNRLAKVSAVFGSVLQSILDLVGKVADGLVSLAAAPVESFKKIKQAAVDYIVEPVKGVIDTVKAAYKYVTNLGNAEVRNEAAAEFALGWVRATSGVRKAEEAIGGYVKGVADAARKSAELADRQAALDKQTREFAVEEQRLRRAINAEREKASNTELSIAERSAAVAKAKELENTLTAKQVALAQENYDIIKESNALHDSTKEDLQKEADALANVEKTRADGLQRRRELVTQGAAIEKEALTRRLNDERAALDRSVKAAEDAAAERLKIAQEEYEAAAPGSKLEAYQAVAEAETEEVRTQAASREAAARQESAARIQQQKLTGDALVAEEARLSEQLTAIKAETDAQLSALGRQQAREAVQVAKEDADARLEAATRGAELEAAARKDALGEQLEAGAISYEKYAKEVEAIERDLNRQSLDIQAAMLSEQLAKLELTEEEREKITQKYYDAVQAMREADAEAEDTAQKEKIAKAVAWMQVAQDSLSAIDELAGAIFERRLDELEKEQGAIDARYDAQVAALENAGYSDEVQQRKAMALEAERAKESEALAKKQAEVKRKQAIYDRAMAVLQATIATSVAIMQAFAQTGPIAGAVMAGIIGALGAVQIAAILAAPLPQYKEGREGGKGEWAIVGDGGRSEVVEGAGGAYLTPAKPTLTYLQPGDSVYKSEAEYRRRAGGGDALDTRPLVAAQERTTKAVERWKGVSIRATSAGLALLGHKGGGGARRYGQRSIKH